MTENSTQSAALPIEDARILIMGGASLVGSATAEFLLEKGAREVVVLDSFYQGTPEALKHIAHNPRLKVVRGDVLRLPQLIEATKGVDGVLHLAAVMTITMNEDPWVGLDVNIRGLQNSLEACRLNGVRKVVFASSNAAYGYGPGIRGDLVETTPFHSAGAPPAAILYGASKIIGEQLCRQAHQRHGQDYVVLRYSTVYGERQHYRAANALYIIETHDALLRGERPKVIGDGSEIKHFIHVSDVGRANVAAFEANATDVAVNVSGPEPITTLELVKLVAELAGSDLTAEHVEPDPNKVRLTSGGPWRVDHSRAKEVISWSPQVDMREGIGRLLEWRQRSGT
jgi:UDP-glucose 4-epimerase